MIRQNIATINASAGHYQIHDVTDGSILGPVSFGYSEYKRDPSVSCFGSGILARTSIPGTKRLVFTGFSPLLENFFISTMGGAASALLRTGLTQVSIRGACQQPSALRITRQDGRTQIDFKPISQLEAVWAGYQGKMGTYALQAYLYDRFKQRFPICRILVTGPAAGRTNYGALMSAPISRGRITAADCWAGRGGIGSNLLQRHNICAVIMGGDDDDSSLPAVDANRLEALFQRRFGKRMSQVVFEKTVKYRFDPELGTGGTLGVNFHKQKGWLFSYNYKSIYMSEAERLQIHREFVANHYLKEFNQQTIEKKQYRHCGEACVAVCKKMNGERKKDYEPYQAFGPNCGIFDQGAAERCNQFADAMGFDAIQAGMVAAWVIDLIHDGRLPKGDFGLRTDPKFDPENFHVIADSHRNADLAIEILTAIVYDPCAEVLRRGIRSAAKELSQRYGPDVIHYAVFNAFGDQGCIVPNQYWVPGMFSPMPIMGKYYQDYSADFRATRALGRKNAQRMVKELVIDEVGMCRFHRGWAEDLIAAIVEEVCGTNCNLSGRINNLARELVEDSQPVFWESFRVIDIIELYLRKILAENPANAEARRWVDLFDTNKLEAAREYWRQLLDGVAEGIQETRVDRSDGDRASWQDTQ